MSILSEEKQQKLRTQQTVPEILAPAGDKNSFFAALAAGADAIYCGLKKYSARMAAKNFEISELAYLVSLAHDMNKKVYLALNSILRPIDLDETGKLLSLIERSIKPDAIIIQDLSLIDLVKQAGYTGEIHLSTLANISFASALKIADTDLNVQRAVIPRELNIDEIKLISNACPKKMGLEVFVHGALCYGVSGRCYWSSYLGGKSGLRGRCVQPCRRQYTQGGEAKKFFSCQDLSLDVLVKVLGSIPEIRAWKIEGRKKGPHYVYYTVRAYRILRDLEKNPDEKSIAKKTALSLLDYALGRPGTHYNFLPQRPQCPVKTDQHTGSGMFVGKVYGFKQKNYLIPREELLRGDLLRIGYEDESFHAIKKVNKYVPKKGRLYLKLPSKAGLVKNSPVFLIDRREQALEELIEKYNRNFNPTSKAGPANVIDQIEFKVLLPPKATKQNKTYDLYVRRQAGKLANTRHAGYWVVPEYQKKAHGINPGTWWWLPPVLWPVDEKTLKDQIAFICKNGGRNFVLNSPWQVALFTKGKKLNLWAGPFCNLTNPLAIKVIASIGFTGAVVSPELGREDLVKLPSHSPLPLGIVVSGSWPLCISRYISSDLKSSSPFTSPRGEQAWVKKYGPDYWVFPNWQLDLTMKKNELQKAGYTMFVHLEEPIPSKVKLKKRPGNWNWDLRFL